jgi:hypothetical protein
MERANPRLLVVTLVVARGHQQKIGIILGRVNEQLSLDESGRDL